MKAVVGVLSFLLVLAAAVVVWQELRRREAVEVGAAHANAVADTFQAVVDVQAGTIEERGRQLVDRDAALDSLGQYNEDLARSLGDAQVTLLGYTRTIGVLRDSVRRLETRPDTLPSGTVRFPIAWHVERDSVNYYGVTGALFAEPAGGHFFDLDLEVGFSLDITVSRTPDLALRCDAVTGLPGVARLTALHCLDQLDDPIGSPPQPFGLRMFEPPALVTGTVGTLIGLILGYAAGKK